MALEVKLRFADSMAVQVGGGGGEFSKFAEILGAAKAGA